MNVSRETQIAAYIGLLQRWGTTLNLTSARSSSADALRKLVDDCLCVVPHLPPQLDRLIDLGAGQGFPAIPIAIETGIAIDLIDADRRKAAFLTTAMASLGLRGAVHPDRIESLSLPPARCVTARALARVPALIDMAKPFLAADGWCLFLKGPAAADEVAGLAADPTIHVELLQTSRPPSHIVKVTLVG